MKDTLSVDGLDLTEKTVPLPTPSPRQQRWLALVKEFPYARLLAECPYNESCPPKPLTRDQLAPIVGSLFTNEHRAILGELLFELLADGIETMILTVLEREQQ